MIKFGTGGFRGVIGDDFTKANVQLVTQALCDMIGQEGASKPIPVGYDMRFGSELFAEWTAEVLAANGVTALLYTQAMPTPAVMTAVRDDGLDYGIMITASHNPYYFNGVKIFVKGADADVAFTDRLEQAVSKVKEVKTMPVSRAISCGLVREYSNFDQYISNIMSFLSSKVRGSKLKILFDNLCGVGASCIVPLFSMLDIKNFQALNCDRDAFFNFINPNPTRENMLTLSERVVAEGFDFAMGTDSDSDRLGILDEKGNYVSSNDILGCLYYYLVKYRGMKGDIVKNCATSVLCDMLADKLGYACHEVDVGFKNISSAIREHDALIGGESSGGLTVRGYIFGKDSVFSSALFTEMVTVMGKPVSQIVKKVREFAGYKLVSVEDEIRFSDESEEHIMRRIDASIPAFDIPLKGVERINRNFKYHFSGDRWALIRLSGTEPVFRVFAEFATAKECESAINALRAVILAG